MKKKTFYHFIEKWKLKNKLRKMDDEWYLDGGNCFGLFPPSFYYTHDEDEISCITQNEINKLKEILKNYEYRLHQKEDDAKYM